MSDESKEKKKRPSLTFHLCNKFMNLIYRLFSGGRLYEIAANGSRSYSNSFIGTRMLARSSGQSGLRRRATIFFSNSRLVGFFAACNNMLASLSASVYAVFFIVYGLVSALVTYTATFLDPNGGSGFSGIFASILTIVVSMPFLLTQRSLREVISSSFFGRKIALTFFMIPEESLQSKRHIGTPAHMVVFAILGLMVGATSFYFHPIVVPIAVLGLFLFIIIMSFPEAGIMITSVIVPFLPYVDYSEEILAVTVITTSLSFLIKKYSGKRVSMRSARTVMLSLLCIFMLLVSFFSTGGIATAIEAVYTVIILFGGFFVTYNLVKSERRLEMCTRALTWSFGMLVVAGLLDLFYNGIGALLINSSWTDIGAIVSKRVFYIAESASTFGVVAALLCPLVFSRSISRKSIIGVSFSIILFGVAIATTFVFGTYESVIALFVGLLIYVMLSSRRSFMILVIIALCICVAVLLFWSFASDSIFYSAVDTLETLIPTADPQAEIRESVVSGTGKMLFDEGLTGIGVGETAFVSSFKSYASVVSASATDPGTLYMQILCWSGIGGLICFAVFMISVCGNTVGYLITSTDKRIRCTVLALFCGVVAALLLGMVNAIWTDIRMFYLFWMCVALLCGYVRLGRENEEKKALSYESIDNKADIEIRFHG